MANQPLQPLDYATPMPHRRTGLNTLEISGAAMIFALLLGIPDVKVNPGGPFISIHAELVPTALCLCAIVAGCRVIYVGTGKRRILATVFVLLAAGQEFLIVNFVLSFWFDRYSRGQLFGL